MLEANALAENLVELLKTWHVGLIISLIALDLLLGVGAALRKKEFNIQKVGEFYLSNVLPFVIGYAAWGVALAWLRWNPADLALLNVTIGEFVLGDVITTMGESLGLTVVILALGTSIIRNAGELYLGHALWRGVEEVVYTQTTTTSSAPSKPSPRPQVPPEPPLPPVKDDWNRRG